MASVLIGFAAAACGDDEPSGSQTTTGSAGHGGGTTGAGGGSTTTSSSQGGSGAASTFSCASPDPAWLLCEDFENGAGDRAAWLASAPFIDGPGMDDPGRFTLSSEQHRSGGWAAYMPAAPESGYQGASLDWYDCDGAQQANCPLVSHPALYFRAWIRFAEDHQLVHHFLSIDGSQPDDFWYHGTAGCMPDGSLAMGTTVDSAPDTHESYFYTYFPGMSCDTNCGNYADVGAICQGCADKGLPTCDQQQQCCWGNEFHATPAHQFPVGQWFCFEMMMRPNDVGQTNGEMAYWVDGAEIHRESSMSWRTSPTLELNRVRLQHYIETSDAAGHSNRVWFDDVVVSEQPIGCD